MEDKMKNKLWIKLTEETEPEKEVLAIGYQKECLIGYISNEDGDWFCVNDNEFLEEVTHYINLEELRKLLD